MGIIGSKTNVKQAHEARENEKEDAPLIAEDRSDSAGKYNPVEHADRELPITESEKLLHIYKEEQELGNLTANTNKKDLKKLKPRQHYKTSDYHDCGRRTVIPTIASTGDDMNIPSSKSGDDVFVIDSKTDMLNVEPTKARTLSMTTQISPKYQKLMSPAYNDVTKLINPATPKNPFIQNFQNRLEQRCDDTVGPLKPVILGKLGIEKNQIRSELEQQGLLVSDTLSAAAGLNVDPKQQGIMGELREIGIIQKVTTADNGYTMSSGSPVRRPPPRLTKLPPLDRDTNLIFAEEGAPEHAKVNTELEFRGTFDRERIDESLRLQLKLLDTEIL